MKYITYILFLTTILFLFAGLNVKAQDIPGTTVQATIIDGDTVAYMSLPVVRVYAPKIFKSKEQERQWSRLVRNVKVAYPYAVLAAQKMNDYNSILMNIKSEKEKDRMMKQAEEDLKKQFEKDVRNMTFSQGKILIKLIYRQTGNTSYEIVKQFRGSLSAFFWQSVARLFGANLKDQYDAEGDDKMIEEIVIMIEKGDL